MGDSQVFLSILYSIPYIVLCGLCALANIEKQYRGQQFWLPIAALIYVAVVMTGMTDISSAIFNTILEDEELLGLIADGEEEHLTARMIFILNACIAGLFLIIKVMLLPILRFFLNSDSVMENTAAYFGYEKKAGLLPAEYRADGGVKKDDDDDDDDDDDGKKKKRKKKKKGEDDKESWWILKPNYRQYKRLFMGFYIALFIASAILFILSCAYPELAIFRVPYYPVFGVILLGEIAFYLGGLESLDPIVKKEEKPKKKTLSPQFKALREELREKFGSHELNETVFEPSAVPKFSADQLDVYLTAKDRDSAIVGEHFRSLLNAGHALDANYIQTSMWLMQGRSAVFYNPFYRDLTDYLLLPIARHLMKYHKCLIVLGRDSAAEDVRSWLRSGMAEFSGTGSLWKTDILTPDIDDTDIGILKFSDIYDRELHEIHRDFLRRVGFILLIEPSRILATGQMGLSILVNQCESDGKQIVFSACDRNCDGLVDALSHMLKTNITDVTATLYSTASRTYIYWAADGEYMHHAILPDVSRYLGMGTEINTLALKHQIRPVLWVSGDRFPVFDMKWIDGQYFAQICGAAKLEPSQAAFNEAFRVESNFWSEGPIARPCFVIEDEFRNIFEITRLFSTRSTDEGCFNVLSEHYFLRDYMIENIKTLMFDPKAIPTIVPDFARTERNLVLKLIMMMAGGRVRESWIGKELAIAGIAPQNVGSDDIQACLSKLFEKHCGAEMSGLRPEWENETRGDAITSVPIRCCSIRKGTALDEYAKKLKSAYLIAEDESGDKHYIGASLYGHVYQAYLPGQFITSEGKYYQVQTITAENGIVVRRAADHISGRQYYRQIRRIHITDWQNSSAMGSTRAMTQWHNGVAQKIEIIFGYADFSVATDGYLELNEPCDLMHAKRFDVSDIPVRSYRHKSTLRLKLYHAAPRVRYTICLLLNEIFKTIYPEAWPYITAVTDTKDIDLEYLTYAMPEVTYPDDPDAETNTPAPAAAPENDIGDLFKDIAIDRENGENDGENGLFDEFGDLGSEDGEEEIPEQETYPEFGYIDFIEDSEIDLGLTVSIERNLERFLEIITEALIWHGEKMAVPVPPEEEENDINDMYNAVDGGEYDGEESLSLWERIKRFFRNLFSSDDEEDTDADTAGQIDENILKREKEKLEKRLERERMAWYRNHCFLRYGSEDEFPGCLDIEGTIEYLSGYGFDKNPLRAVREAAKKQQEKDNKNNPRSNE